MKNLKEILSKKTKVVCTIGPSSESVECIKELIKAGMNVARLNFSHGDFDYHALLIKRIREAERETGVPVAIMADLPGPKMRIGVFKKEPVHLKKGDTFILTTKDILGDEKRVSITMKELPPAVSPGNLLYLSDGIIELKVLETSDTDIKCQVIVGGELRSKKGLNIPGIDLGKSAFTKRDRECLEFALKEGVDAVSQSFVGSEDDIRDVRAFCKGLGRNPFLISKIERLKAIDRIDEIISASDGIMVARGDLGVEVPIEEIAVLQKYITRRALLQAKPVITATQMLESMTKNRRPTRAEATDVANAILDGTDAVMLSEESATGNFPVDAARMLSKIAVAIEKYIPRDFFKGLLSERSCDDERKRVVDLMAQGVNKMIDELDVAGLFCPTETGRTARVFTSYRFPCWIVTANTSKKTQRELLFSYGVVPFYFEKRPERWVTSVKDTLFALRLTGSFAIMTEGPSRLHPKKDHRLEIVSLKKE